MTAHCRIGRIRMKTGGADVRVIDATPPKTQFGAALMMNARTVATRWDNLAGYVMIGWDSGGGYTVGWRYDPEAGGIPPTLLPSWVAEVVRREIVSAQAVRDVIDREYRPPQPRPPA